MAETTASPTDDWLAPTMEHPLSVAVISKSIDSPNDCSHRLKMEKLLNHLEKQESKCPICEEVIGFVQDGVVSGRPKVFFKFRKQLFRIGVEDTRTWYRKELLAQQRIARIFGMKIDTLKVRLMNTTTKKIYVGDEN